MHTVTVNTVKMKVYPGGDLGRSLKYAVGLSDGRTACGDTLSELREDIALVLAGCHCALSEAIAELIVFEASDELASTFRITD
jgi:hypothetical protein